MLRGVPIGNRYRKARLIRAYYDEQWTQMLQTLIMVAAARDGDISSLLRDYKEAIFPTGAYSEESIEKWSELIEQEGKKVYSVKKEDEEDW
jgi:hypothetical protein